MDCKPPLLMSSLKNGNPNSLFEEARRQIAIRKKTMASEVSESKQPHPPVNPEMATDYDRDKEGSEDEDPEVLAIMEKIDPPSDSTKNKKRNYSKIVVGYESFLLTLDRKTKPLLDNKPSCSDGLSPEEEEDLRLLGVQLIEVMIHLLKLPMVVGETASIFFQRFYSLKSFVRHAFDHNVMACVLLATKVEESFRRPREIINVFDRIKKLYMHQENPSVELSVLPIDGKYVMMKNHVVAAERRILLTLGFVCQIKHPHGYIYVFLKTLGLMNHNEILNAAWATMNDCMRTDLFLRFYCKTLAAACVVRTCRSVNPEVVLPTYNGYQWHEVYGISSRDVEFVIETLERLYSRTDKPDWGKLQQSVTEARRKKFGAEKVETITEEEVKKSINDEEDEERKENDKKANYAKKLSPSRSAKQEPSKSPERLREDKSRDRKRNRYEDRDRRRDRDDRNKKERDRKSHDRRDRDHRSRSRSVDRRRRDRKRSSSRDRSRSKRNRRSRSRSPNRIKTQRV